MILSCCPVPRDSDLLVLLPHSYLIGRNIFIKDHVRGGRKVDLRPRSEALGRTNDDSYDSMLRGMPCANPTDFCMNQLASARNSAWPYYQHCISASAVWRAHGFSPFFLLSAGIVYVYMSHVLCDNRYSHMCIHRHRKPCSYLPHSSLRYVADLYPIGARHVFAIRLIQTFRISMTC